MEASVHAEPARHLRARGEGEQSITVVELFFDLVYVFAVTQLSHVLIDHLSFSGAARTVFLLLIVWWAWIYTTWMVNWFDPASPPVRLVLIGVMGASLLLAAALPEAFGAHGALFVLAYVGLQVGRNAAASLLLPRGHALRRSLERITVWSVGSGVLWIGGLLETGDHRLLWWIPALAVELIAPIAGYRTPGLGTSLTTDWNIEGGHFAERCQGFIIIALGESIVVTG
ncbi:MAG TPA: low temperature requirement protein A, partial [Gaiellales bacterium]